jgi:hypothetical protein
VTTTMMTRSPYDCGTHCSTAPCIEGGEVIAKSSGRNVTTGESDAVPAVSGNATDIGGAQKAKPA